ncbi:MULTISPECIES: RdgB/HAM1 family non-canonical purine NTP pyrophosphatase [Actinotignum]|uniref:dITP/XTP pyrophosphatase n=1 Tax=Actinotignum timonense TaxID=1870995 RepID=A0AAW9HFU3_9ACTO|nr:MULTISPECIES: RdgB/HAM1 family non-canonical purine NTP pyrophosphatase [Actinotignum]MDE1557774.1 RdgB/HAM1 family non-canonical purine NTP pyrophosphatase [Actinotignum schaalii]MDE1663726.1 RdgB/HAM1 family non-canonical purine NTP pyrophosphatase [Actinotignum schaalii]MDK6373565.1 RdgB/HAM1 family non-canonical purine NTP pyrophosphatase [Actinotignum timonense]MDK6418619.1 RdgB/HAM1 family non-canonical purine NTP pyrophosphatase [Actinotignum timonense]MDK6644372.1 RdgB/HAM1 family n
MEVAQPRRVVVATGNAHKVTELRNILAPWLQEIELVSGAEFAVPEPVEDGTTFAQNALIKARAYARATGLPAIADDSGLCVDILGGAPGIFSARWSGHHGDDAANRQLLLAQLADVPLANRGAHFHCAAALVTPEGHEEVREGEMPGILLTAERGSGGFGYDPIFAPAGSSRSNAELSPEEKDAISHRGKAFAQLAPVIVQVLAERA